MSLLRLGSLGCRGGIVVFGKAGTQTLRIRLRGSAVTGLSRGAGDSRHCRRRSDWTDLVAAFSSQTNWDFFFSTFTPSWTKPLNVNIAVALDGGVKDQSAIHKALYGVFVSNMYAIFVFILCYIPH